MLPPAAHTYDAAANWKILSENYHECYHCPTIDPELCSVSPPHSGENYDSSGTWTGGWMELRDGPSPCRSTGTATACPVTRCSDRRPARAHRPQPQKTLGIGDRCTVTWEHGHTGTREHGHTGKSTRITARRTLGLLTSLKPASAKTWTAPTCSSPQVISRPGWVRIP
jgi:phenylpropionate dioxygenase-like ring-hydroxylating dioxygenase large terminal subunit